MQTLSSAKWFLCSAALLCGLFLPAAAPAQERAPAPPRVIRVSDPTAIREYQVDGSKAAALLERGLSLWGQTNDPAAALSKIISPNDVVGIRISTTGGPGFRTQPGIIEALIRSLVRAGVPADKILIWDKHTEQLERAGYDPASVFLGAKVVGVLPDSGYSDKEYYTHPVMGQLVWGDHDFRGVRTAPASKEEDLLKKALADASSKGAAKLAGTPTPPTHDEPKDDPKQISNKSYFAKIVTETCTKIIHVPVFSDSDALGFEGCIAGLAMAAVDNNRRFQFAPQFGDPCLPEILDHDVLKERTVLHIMDATLAQFAGGPAFVPRYNREHATLYISSDPVAIDTLAVEQMEKWRASMLLPPVTKKLDYLKTAADLGLGQNDLKHIRIEGDLPPK